MAAAFRDSGKPGVRIRKKTDPNPCDCLAKVNAKLEAEQCVVISSGFCLGGRVYPLLQVESVKTRRVKSNLRMTCNFCPFCGVELPK